MGREAGFALHIFNCSLPFEALLGGGAGAELLGCACPGERWYSINMSGSYRCISGEHLWLPCSLASPSLVAAASVGTYSLLPVPLGSEASQHPWDPWGPCGCSSLLLLVGWCSWRFYTEQACAYKLDTTSSLENTKRCICYTF